MSLLSAQQAVNDIKSIFQLIETQNRYVDELSDIGTGENSARNLPVGIKKIVGNTPITLAINNIKFGPQYGEIALYAKIDIPQQSQSLIFGAQGIKISNEGDLVGDVKLSLLEDTTISLGNMGKVKLKGSMDAGSGLSSSQTFVLLECNGEMKELSLDAEIELNKNTFVLAADKSKPVRASFKARIADWNDLIASVSFPAFEIKGAEGFQFTLTNASLDLSDVRNPLSFQPDSNYMERYFTLPDRNMWRGMYVEEFSVTFPEWFKKKDSNDKIHLSVKKLLIDENGITGDIFGENILPIENGDAGGWAFSVQTFQLSFVANNISKFGFGGQIDIPISGESQLRPYEAYIAKDEYIFKAMLGENLDFTLFGDTKLQLDSSSYLLLELRNRRFLPKVVLNGSMELKVEALELEQVIFKKLSISPETFSVESMGYGGEAKLNKFPISISDMQFQADNNLASMGFKLDINLMEGKIGAGSSLKVESEQRDRRWKTKGLSIEAIRLDKVSLSGFNLSGEIRMEKDNPVYGNYFGGQISATFNALSDRLSVHAVSVFGTKDAMRYWYVEGQVLLPAGIPVGPVKLTGFTGGAYYRMSATGKPGLEAYAPDPACSLGLKAGVSFNIGSDKAVNGDALFEMNFLSTGGIKNIRFYGTAEFMSAADLTGKLEKLTSMYKKAQSNVKDVSKSFSDEIAPNMPGTDVAKKLIPDANFTAAVTAYLTMDFDFPSKTFDADFRVRVTTPGGFIRGTGANNEAGWAKLHCSPRTWYIHIGTPANPVGLELRLGPLALSSRSYFMFGDKLEKPLAPPPAVLNTLHITAVEADYMKYPDQMQLGKGIGFGSRFDFSTGDITFLILYANFSAGTGFDIMLSDMSDYACEGNTTPVGLNGWYANGQCYAYLKGSLGVKVKLLFINKRFEVIKGATAALLQAKFPNPTWIGGQLAVELNILNGLVKANMKMKLSFGNDCKLVRLDGSATPIEFPLISDMNPIDGATDVDVFSAPQVTFNMALTKPFNIMDDDGSTKSYRIRLEDFYITDHNGRRVPGKLRIAHDNNSATFEPGDILTPRMNMKATATVILEEQRGGSWVAVANAKETKTSSFKTGTAPDYIPLTNIINSYPVLDQKNFYKGESSTGFIQLKTGQPYLFPTAFTYNVVFTSKGGQPLKVAYSYDASSRQLKYSIPVNSMNIQTEYSVSFGVYAKAGQQGTIGNQVSTDVIKDSEGDSYEIEYMKKTAQKILTDGSKSVLDYTFRSSMYTTFTEKVTAVAGTPDYHYRKVDSDIISLILKTNSANEPFDDVETKGSVYSGNVPLISAEAQLTDSYYNTDIKPLVYDVNKTNGIKITDLMYGAPPIKAITLYNNAGYFPYEYLLMVYYGKHYFEVRNTAASLRSKGTVSPAVQRVTESVFPFMRQGNYKTQFIYNIPGGKTGTKKEINYNNPFDWRQ